MHATLTRATPALDPTTDVITTIDRDLPTIRAGQRLLSPSLARVERSIRAIPEGACRDIATLRRELAAGTGAHATSLPVLRERLLAIAETVFAELDDGALLGEVTPIWRVHLEHSDALLRQLSFEPAFLHDLRASERPRATEPARRAA